MNIMDPETRVILEAYLVLLQTLWAIHAADYDTAKQTCDRVTLEALHTEGRALYREVSEVKAALRNTV